MPLVKPPRAEAGLIIDDGHPIVATESQRQLMVGHLRQHPEELAQWRSCYQAIADSWRCSLLEAAPEWLRPLLTESHTEDTQCHS